MARSWRDIYSLIIQDKETFDSLDGLLPSNDSAEAYLDDLTSNSKVSRWRHFVYIVARAHETLEVLWDRFTVYILALIASTKVGSLPWYVKISKEFQVGYTVEIINYFYGYQVVDEAAQIVKHASAIEDGSNIFVKVAKDGASDLEPLTTLELDQFTTYMRKMRPAGIPVICSSLDADQLRAVIEVEYDSILPVATVLEEVKTAIADYVQNLPFDARFRTLNLVDAIQLVTGVTDVKVISLIGAVGQVQTAIDQTYIAQAGYMRFDEANSNISMIPA